MPERGTVEAAFTVSPGAPELDLGCLERLVGVFGEREGVSGEVGVWICTDDEIADLHERFMGIPGPTDVMSFPGDGSPDGQRYLGDIAISFETALEQASAAGHSIGREIAYLVLHGLLHLIGYDDVEEDQRRRMLDRQDALLTAFERESGCEWT